MSGGKSSKYSKEQKKLVLKLYEEGEALKNIPKKTGVFYSSVQRIVRSVYPPEKQRSDHSVPIDPVNPYGLNPYIAKLKKRLKPGNKISVDSSKGEVVKTYENFFVIQGRNYKESFTYVYFLLRKGEIL